MTTETASSIAHSHGLNVQDAQVAKLLDAQDPLSSFRSKFTIPTKEEFLAPRSTGSSIKGSDPVIYLCGNSLGLLPKRTPGLLEQELRVWSKKGVHGHFDHEFNRPWVTIDDTVVNKMAQIVGAAKDSEVAIMNTLTANLHFLMVSFYRPHGTRTKILMESRAFPSDYFAVESQVKFHGFDPATNIIELSPRPGEHSLRHEDILGAIKEHGQEIALVLFSGIQYYTGQLFNMKDIARAGHEEGCIVGFDLAHAVGNVPLKLHDWDVDFAVWCTYKYLNSGPGGIGGAFIHSKLQTEDLPRFTGWWGTDPKTKFDMDNVFRPIQGANGYRVSNPNVLATISLLGSLEIFSETSMEALRQKSFLLTGYLESLLKEILVGQNQGKSALFEIITPSDPEERGCQLSILFPEGKMMSIFEHLESHGVVVDERKPNVIRVAPAPLYNSFEDVFHFVELLKEALFA